MTALTPERLAEIRERLTAATSAPWEFERRETLQPFGVVASLSQFRVRRIARCGSPRQYTDQALDAEDEANARLIAAAPQDIRELLAHIDHLAALIERMRSEAPPYRNEVVEAQEADRVSNPRTEG